MGKLRQTALILGEGPTEFFYFKSLCDVFKRLTIYNPQNEMFRLLGTKRSFSQNETFFFSHPYPALFRLISHF